MKVSCMSLWVEWKKNEPDHRFVIEATQRISQYSKEDWVLMSNEATDIVNELADIVKNNISIDDIQNKEILKKLAKHLSDWFFVPDIEYFAKFSECLLFFKQYRDFFDQFYPGTSNHLFSVIDRYSEEVSQSFMV